VGVEVIVVAGERINEGTGVEVSVLNKPVGMTGEAVVEWLSDSAGVPEQAA